MSAILAVVGTDTGVGKTVVGAGLLHALGRAGYRVAGFKVVETGISDPREGALSEPADWERLEQASGQLSGSGLGLAFPLPAAPLVAARAAGRSISPTDLEDRLATLVERHDLVVVEGAGGLLVPLSEGLLWGDLLERWAPPCLLVGRLGLGSINHTLLTLEALRSRGMDPLGVLLVSTVPPGPESIYTSDIIYEFGNNPVLTTLPFGMTDPKAVADHLCRHGVLSLLGPLLPPKDPLPR